VVLLSLAAGFADDPVAFEEEEGFAREEEPPENLKP
jgi:hypothetical protein